MNTQFDDAKLVKLAKRAYYSLKGEKFAHLESLLHKKTLTDGDRNKLLDLVDAGHAAKPTSIKEMKEDIFSLIGCKSPNPYGSTVSRSELEIIHKHLLSTK